MEEKDILGFKINFSDDLIKIIKKEKSKGYYIFANTNTLVEAKNDSLLEKSLKNSNMNLPDGFPLALMARIKGLKNARKIGGPDFTLNFIKYIEKNNQPCCFYGGTREQADKRKEILLKIFPRLNFLSFSEDKEISMMKSLNKNKIKYLFVSLGSPKQEIWAYKNKNKINATIFCVGAAIPYILEDYKRAPKIIRNLYLEWLYRLINQPRHSFKRYIINGPKFLLFSISDIFNK
jgi:N-acetylglucosaminyldiphosphoundecaprenol N-acetyl-beta-D-mannosaminyltransferase